MVGQIEENPLFPITSKDKAKPTTMNSIDPDPDALTWLAEAFKSFPPILLSNKQQVPKTGKKHGKNHVETVTNKKC